MALGCFLLLGCLLVPVSQSGSEEGAPRVLEALQVQSSDAWWVRPLLGSEQVLAATVGDPGLSLAPTTGGPEGDLPSGIAYTVDGSQYLVAHRDSRNVLVFDATTRAFVSEIALSGSPLDLAVSPDGLWAATANGFEGTVSLIDLSSSTETAAITVGDVPMSLDFTPDSARIAVANFAGGSLSSIDVASATELFEVSLGSLVASLSFAFESGASSLGGTDLICTGANTAVVPLFFDDELAFCDLSSGAVNRLPVTADPRGMAFAETPGRLAVSHTGSARTVTVVDPAAQTVIQSWTTTIDLSGPIAIRLNGARAAVAVQNAVLVLNLTTGAAGPVLNTASVSQLLTTADGQFALGVGFNGPLISYNGQNLVAQTNQSLSVNVGAVSPVAATAVMTGPLFGEQVVSVTTDGGAAGLVAVETSGVAPEADASRRVAVSADGRIAVATNVLSDNASVIDLKSGALLGVVATGDRPSGVAITPDGATAVVANLDSTFATLIDLGSLTTREVPISTRASEVRVSADGQFAYLSVVSNGDGVWRLDIAAGASSGGKLLTGNMGGVGGAFSQSSGLELSPDGSTLVACGSFDDVVTLIDTASWSVRATLPAAQFPVKAVFSPDGSKLYVSARTSQELIAFDLTPTGGVEVGRAPLGFSPLEFVVNAAGTRAFGLDTSNAELEVVDLGALSVIASLPLAGTGIDLVYDASDDSVEVISGGATTTLGGSVGFEVSESGSWERFDATTLQRIGGAETGLATSDLQLAGGRVAATAIRNDELVVGPSAPSLRADTIAVSTAAGGTQSLALDAGAARAGDLYLVLGSASGTSPGLPLDGQLIPLQLDNYTLTTLNSANSGAYVNTLGALDASGQGSAAIAVPAGVLTGLAGVSVDHAFVALDPVFASVRFASNPVALRLID